MFCFLLNYVPLIVKLTNLTKLKSNPPVCNVKEILNWPNCLNFKEMLGNYFNKVIMFTTNQLTVLQIEQ